MSELKDCRCSSTTSSRWITESCPRYTAVLARSEDEWHCIEELRHSQLQLELEPAVLGQRRLRVLEQRHRFGLPNFWQPGTQMRAWEQPLGHSSGQWSPSVLAHGLCQGPFGPGGKSLLSQNKNMSFRRPSYRPRIPKTMP
uniref:Uncharacterized protein n=1 Tax=Chelonoidis abingdonii TaxID=106734 RepID=A0A8C0G1J8_CHEAB